MDFFAQSVADRKTRERIIIVSEKKKKCSTTIHLDIVIVIVCSYVMCIKI